MSNKQLDEFRSLFVEHGEVLATFYDEGVCYGFGLAKNSTYCIIGGVIGFGIVYGIAKIHSQIKKTKIEP